MLISIFTILELDTMSNSVLPPRAGVFSFLSLPLELRWMIYMYALVTPFGLWMDNYRRDIPGILRKQGFGPGPNDLLAVESIRGIVSPALLLVCKQIYNEARHLLRQNQWRLNRWCTFVIADLPASARANVTSLFLGRDPSGHYGPAGTRPALVTFHNMVKHLPNIQHLTIALVNDDKGLTGPFPPMAKYDDLDGVPKGDPIYRLQMNKHIFQRGSMIKTIGLECIKTYPSRMYPWVYMWTWVTYLAMCVLPDYGDRPKLQKLRDLIGEVDKHLGSYGFGGILAYRDYSRLQDPSNEPGEDTHALLRRLRETWEEFGIRVSARDPSPFERGTMIVFERIPADGGSRVSEVDGC